MLYIFLSNKEETMLTYLQRLSWLKNKIHHNDENDEGVRYYFNLERPNEDDLIFFVYGTSIDEATKKASAHACALERASDHEDHPQVSLP